MPTRVNYNSVRYESYEKPSSFEQFVSELNAACDSGEEAAKKAIEELASDIAGTLKRHKEWDAPKIGVNIPSSVNLLSTGGIDQTHDIQSLFTEITAARLGPVLNSGDSTHTTESDQDDQEYSHALVNLITEISLSDIQSMCASDVQGEKKTGNVYTQTVATT